MSVSIPQPFRTTVTVAQPFRTRVEGMPDTYHMHIEEIPTLRLAVEELPTIRLSVEKLPKVQMGMDPIEIRLTEVPQTRTHLPADFTVALSVLGMELLGVRLCGEAQMITEPYRPNPCEVCGGGRLEWRGGSLDPVDGFEVAETEGRGGAGG